MEPMERVSPIRPGRVSLDSMVSMSSTFILDSVVSMRSMVDLAR